MSSCLPSAHLHLSCTEIVASNLFGTRDGFHGRQIFPQVVCVCVWGGVMVHSRMTQEHYIYCSLYFYYCYISYISDRQASAPGGWGPLQ